MKKQKSNKTQPMFYARLPRLLREPYIYVNVKGLGYIKAVLQTHPNPAIAAVRAKLERQKIPFVVIDDGGFIIFDTRGADLV